MKGVPLLLLILAAKAALGAPPEPAISSVYEAAPDPLTTAKLRQIDPDELNPHRRNWALERHLGLKGLEATPLEDGTFSVRVVGIESAVKSYVRGEGPWFQPLQDFSCSGIKSHPWFATRDGSLKAADAAAREWNDVLGRERLKLAQRFSRVSVHSRLQALAKATQIYHGWLEQTEALWRSRVYDRARKAELEFYRQAVALDKPACGTTPALPEHIRERMEFVADVPKRTFLARAPSRRWEGAFSVRLSLEVGDKKLNGAFLIDSTTPRSIISPSWLEAQGIPEAYVELSDVSLDRAIFATNPGGGLARRAGFDRVLMSGFVLPVSEFLIYETAIYDVPETIAPCCAGVLGNDFLRKFSVELDPGTPSEVVLYDPNDYSEGKDSLWEEASFYQRDAIASPCKLESVAGAKGAKPLTPVRWSTAGSVPSGTVNHLELRCADEPVASQLQVDGKPHLLAVAGNPLFSRGPVTLDLPNGRIWFSKKMREAKPLENRTGLALDFVLRKAERVLVVKSIRSGSLAARVLGAVGLKVGAEITEIDATPADELDRWQVERRLAGAYGATVKLGWSTPKGARVEQLDLSGEPAPKTNTKPKPKPKAANAG